MPWEAQYSKKELIDDLQDCSNIVTGSLSVRKYKDIGEVDPQTIKDRFGSWNRGKEAAGLDIEKIGGNKSSTKEKIISELHSVSGEVEGNLSVPDFDKRGNISVHIVIHHFGSWNEAKEAAGIETIDEYNGMEDKRKEHRLEMIKCSLPCSRCGEKYPKPAMDFHHRVKGEKSFDIGANIHTRWKNLAEELKKCDLLCANCHRIIESTKNE